MEESRNNRGVEVIDAPNPDMMLLKVVMKMEPRGWVCLVCDRYWAANIVVAMPTLFLFENRKCGIAPLRMRLHLRGLQRL